MRSIGIAALCLAMTTGVLAEDDVETLTGDLGTYGEVNRWLMLGYLPKEGALSDDRLEPIGGEAELPKRIPYAGQHLRVPDVDEATGPDGRSRVQWVETGNPGERMMDGFFRRACLFVDENRDPITNHTAYLLCSLVSPEDKDARLLVRVGGCDAKVLLRGQAVYPPGGQRSKTPWYPDEIDVRLQAGVNPVVVRMDGRWAPAWLELRVLSPQGMPLRDVKSQIRVRRGFPPYEQPLLKTKPWSEIKAEIPPVPPSKKQLLLGSRLTRTMSLLESGAATRRPVRIVFYGQSITDQEWTQLLVDALRERFPRTRIIAINRAIGGWGVPLLQKTIQYDVLGERPDLVCFHAYQGSFAQWDRVLSSIRRRTTAEIVIRSAHIRRDPRDRIDQPEGADVPAMSALAQKYDCELVECRQEWVGYLNAHDWDRQRLLRDGIHLSREGNVLMAQLYERHFRNNYSGRSADYRSVRRYDALYPLMSGRTDEIVLTGGWERVSEHDQCVQSASPDDRLTLKFVGTRVDLALAPGSGGARVLIDGRKPTALGVFQGTRPRTKSGKGRPPGQLLAYRLDPEKAEDEAWELTITEKLNDDFTQFKFRLDGSKTGFDGGGDSQSDFVSRSGKIGISHLDWRREKSEADPADGNLKLIWWVTPLGTDEVHCRPAAGYALWDDMPKQYVNVIDRLPCGEHELTLIPLGDGPFALDSIEVHRPPLSRGTQP